MLAVDFTYISIHPRNHEPIRVIPCCTIPGWYGWCHVNSLLVGGFNPCLSDGKHVRCNCNPDVGLRLNSGVPEQDKLMLLPQSTYLPVAMFWMREMCHVGCRSTSGLGRTSLNPHTRLYCCSISNIAHLCQSQLPFNFFMMGIQVYNNSFTNTYDTYGLIYIYTICIYIYSRLYLYA